MEKLKQILKLLDSKQAQELVVLDMQSITSEMDYMIVCHVDNPRLLNALAHYVVDFLAQHHYPSKPLRHSDESGWILIDAQEIIIHLFLQQDRSQYQLEKLWHDCLVEMDYE